MHTGAALSNADVNKSPVLPRLMRRDLSAARGPFESSFNVQLRKLPEEFFDEETLEILKVTRSSSNETNLPVATKYFVRWNDSELPLLPETLLPGVSDSLRCLLR